MARVFLILGIVLIVVAFAILIFGSELVDNPIVVSVLQGLYCQSGDTMQVTFGPKDYDAQPVYFSCVSSSGAVTDLGSGPLNNAVLIFVVLFLPGMFLMLSGWRSLKADAAKRKNSDVALLFTLAGQRAARQWGDGSCRNPGRAAQPA